MATIQDVANKAGVSTMTVSRAFNDPNKVKQKTRDKIMAIAKEINFHPSSVARSLAKKCTNIIFVYIPKGLFSTEQFVSQTVTAIGERLGESGYSFLLGRKLPEGESFDGVIMMGLSRDEEKDVLHAKTIDKPIVLYGNSDDFDAWVDVDNYSGEYAAVEYLISKNRKNIAVVAAPQKMRYAEERLKGYKDCLKEHGFSVSEDMIAIGEVNENGGYLAAKGLLEKNINIDAFACATDTMAIGVIRALKEGGYKIPEDVAVIGFDGFGHENVVTPKLTTVRQPLFEAGVKLADTLLSVIEGGALQRIKILPTLIKGESA